MPIQIQPANKKLLHDSHFVSAINEGMLRIRSELSLAEYNLTSLELKTWFLVIASLKEEERSLYAISAIDIANKLGLDSRRPRGTIVSTIFRKLKKQNIVLTAENDDGEPSIYDASFFGEVYYDSSSKMLAFSIPPMLHEFLFHLKANLTLSLDISDILKLETVTAIKVFVYLRELDRLGIHSVSISEFRSHINFFATSPYKEYKRRVIKSAEKEIQTRGMYKNFHIDDDGKRGVKATTLYFGFEKTEDNELFLSAVAPKLRKDLIAKFSRRVLALIEFAVKEGFDPSYIKNQFDNYDDDYIAANFYAVFQRIRADRKNKQEKSPDTYGRYFLTAVRDNWAGSAAKALAEKAKQKVQNAALQQQMKEVTEQERFQNEARYLRERAKEYIDALPLDELIRVIKENRKEIDVLAAHGRSFDLDCALTKKKTYREYRILCQLIAGKMMAGQLKVPEPDVPSLF